MPSEDTKKYWDNLINTTSHKVIGYINTAYGSDFFIPLENGHLSDEEYAAILKDFKEKGYLYTGEEFQDSYEACTPVLDNYRYIDFSRRGFARLIAMSQDDYSPLGYAHYTESMFIDNAYKKFPKRGLCEGIHKANNIIEIEENKYNQILNNNGEMFFAIPIPKFTKDYYWIGDTIYLKFQNDKIKVQVEAIAAFNSEEEFKKFLSNRSIKCMISLNDCLISPLLLVSKNK